jgi:hypothetical protein
MKRLSTRRSLRLAVVTTALFVSAAGVALATTALTGPQPTVIQTCKLNGIGTLRVVGAATDCNARLETPLSWNSQGPAGPQGIAGAQGPRGEKGDIGAPGPAGSASLATLAGSPCHDHTGSAGTISIATNTADDVVLHCAVATGGGTPSDQPAVHLVALAFQRNDAAHYTVTVTLSGPVSQATTVSLSSSDTTSVAVPATITVPAGQAAGAAPDGAITILSAAGAEITATLDGESIHATLTPS